ncbi:MAG: ATP phosphoribosyltransferase regulatory subunit [Salinispira sp.]
MNKAHLLKPPSSVPLLLKESVQQQDAVDRTRNLYKRWGYTTVYTPVLDFFDVHSHLFTEEEEKRIYRLIGRNGEIFMLRSDITVFLMRHYRNFLKEAELPLRLAYSDSILRYEESNDISRNEHYQTGVELIGNPHSRDEHDREILFLLCENLRILGLTGCALHIGSQKILDLIIPEDNDSMDALRECIILRDWENLPEHLAAAGINREGQEAVVSIFSSIWEGTEIPRNLNDAIALLPERIAITQELRALVSISDLLTRYFPDIAVRIDLSEIGARHYYSGLTFQVYLPNVPYAVASGGRYDRLLEEMQLHGAAVGYSIMLSAISKAQIKQPDISFPDKKILTGTFEERYNEATILRQKGKNICL